MYDISYGYRRDSTQREIDKANPTNPLYRDGLLPSNHGNDCEDVREVGGATEGDFGNSFLPIFVGDGVSIYYSYFDGVTTLTARVVSEIHVGFSPQQEDEWFSRATNFPQ